MPLTLKQLRWENSGDRVDIGPGRILKHQQDSADLSAYDNTYAYLKPVGFDDKSGYLEDLPYFDLFLEVGSDTEDEFLCMKDGDSQRVFSFRSAFVFKAWVPQARTCTSPPIQTRTTPRTTSRGRL